MKPKWYFAFGSFFMFFSLTGLSMGVIFTINLCLFLIRRNGPLHLWKLKSILSTFPWWIPLIAIVGIILSVWLLKKFDFSYKKNFKLIALIFIVSMFAAGLLLDRLGLNEYLSRGRMGRYYKRIETSNLLENSTRKNGRR